ncbi:MAG: hypothetical protein ACFFA4_06200 [Promethearchaeota archaeon]
MGLEVLNKKIQVDKDKSDESDDFLNISNLIIPFSIIFRKKNPPDIYSGRENISFKEKHSMFQQILISEFLFE